ncbi:sensor domain-containing diguanylate cyclase [Rhodoferax sp. BAB1]|uniref:sensor domain-containing diguanylate cyclase n=1 Tax=Rhodoferax sp. BAB1 TaxID=2741720 RepID=UPI0020C70D60|nr:sensor domain-containing diguanylate cyclase [Rhodoferax sp. BAB1]
MELHPHKDEAQGAHLLLKPAGPQEIRFAWIMVLLSAGLFLLALPYSALQFQRHPVFVPVYVTALIISDLITAVMLYGQYYVLRSRALLILAAAYLFTTLATLGFALLFPGLLAPMGLFGAGPQSTPAMYMFWHAGFPLAVMAYAGAKRRPAALPPAAAPGPARYPILASVAIVLALAAGGLAVAVLGHDELPVVLDGDRVTVAGHRWLFGTWLLSVLALAVLWRSKPHTALDAWLLVVMCVWIFDVALAAVLNTGRYDLGWYAGRAYGLLAACFLLIVLLSEHARSYARLVQVSAELRSANDLLWQISMQDGMTQLANRRAFDKYLQEQNAINARHGRSLGLVLVDVDHFKAYNDLYGHQAGDDCLKRVAAALRSCCRRPSDLAARYGGEEFALILPDTDQLGALYVAETLRNTVLRYQLPHAECSTGPFVSVSVGVALARPGSLTAVEPLLAAADAALYLAKSRGRNQVVYADAATPGPREAPTAPAPLNLSRA